MKFPYIRCSVEPTPAFPNQHSILRPLIPVRIIVNNKKSPRYYALIFDIFVVIFDEEKECVELKQRDKNERKKKRKAKTYQNIANYHLLGKSKRT